MFQTQWPRRVGGPKARRRLARARLARLARAKSPLARGPPAPIICPTNIPHVSRALGAATYGGGIQMGSKHMGHRGIATAVIAAFAAFMTLGLASAQTNPPPAQTSPPPAVTDWPCHWWHTDVLPMVLQ